MGELDEIGGMTPSTYESPVNPALPEYFLGIDTILEELKHDLRGEYYDVETKKWTQDPKFVPLMNDFGVSRIITYCRTILSKISMTTNYVDEIVINKKMTFFSLGLIEIIVKEHEDMALTKPYWNMTIDTVESAIHSGLLKSFQDGERKFWRTTTKQMEVTRRDINEKKGGILPHF